MAQPASDDVHVDTGLEQMHGRRVSPNIRRNGPLSVADANIRTMTPDELVQAEPRQWPAYVAEEYRSGCRCWLVSVSQHLAQQAGGLGPKRAGPPFIALAVEFTRGEEVKTS